MYLFQDRQTTLPLRKTETTLDKAASDHAEQKREATDNPPPPPPVGYHRCIHQ